MIPLVVPQTYALAQENPVLHRLADYRPYDGTQVLRKEPGALYVHYPVNRSYLDTLYRTNNETLDKIVELTARVSADSAAEVRFIEIIGLASPEGPIAFNIRLAQRPCRGVGTLHTGTHGVSRFVVPPCLRWSRMDRVARLCGRHRFYQ